MNRNPFDERYLARLRAGDPETERHFVFHFSNAIRLSLRYRLRSSQMVEDVRQKTFVRVLNSLRSEKSMGRRENLEAYVHSVSIKVMLELLRASAGVASTQDGTHQLADQGVNAESEVVTRQRKDVVRRVLDELPDRDRRILRAVFLEDVDKAEVCKRFDVNHDYLRALVHRAKLRFRAALDKDDVFSS